MAIRIVTDSTADLPAEVAEQLGITVVPLNVHFGEETFLDGVDILPDEFFQRLAAARQLPTTSQPSPGKFMEVYGSLAEAGDQVVSIHISDKLSGTLNSARQAKEQMEGSSIEIIDSKQAALGTGLVAMAAAKAVQQGASYEAVLDEANRAVEQVQLFGLLDTLEYLRKGGRIGMVRGFIGTLLKVRPIITVRDGIVQSETSVRSRSYGIQYMVTLAEERAPLKQAAVMHSSTDEEAEALAERIRPLVADGQVLQGRIGPVVGTHAGPGVIGIVVQSEKTPQAS